MTPEQELTAMIEASMGIVMVEWFLAMKYDQWPSSMAALREDLEAISDMPEPDRQNAALRKLYWLATDPDDMVH